MGTEQGWNRPNRAKGHKGKGPGISLEGPFQGQDMIWQNCGHDCPTRKVTLATKGTPSCLLFLQVQNSGRVAARTGTGPARRQKQGKGDSPKL